MPLKSLDLIRDLIAFDTTSRESNLAFIEYVEAYLGKLGVECMRVYDDEKRKANLYATLGPQDQSGILLSGHTDVVPVDGQDWTSDPFSVREADGKLFGRGTADMKAFIAIALAYAPEMLERGLKTPIHLAFSYDEEVGHLGAKRLVEIIREMPVRPAMCIVGEPTGMDVIVAHKGKRKMRVHVRGLEAHSSLAPKAVNAIEYAAELIAYIKGLARRIEKEGPFDEKFDLTHSTIQVGLIKGGVQLNIVPNSCTFDLELRHLPDDDPVPRLDEIKTYAQETLEPMMHAIDPTTGFTFEDIGTNYSLNIDPGEDIVALVKRLTGRNDHGKVAFGTEAGLFMERAGIPTVVCGPGHIAQAHKPDEFIALEQIAKGEDFMAQLTDYVCGER
ncbi:MAG: acetylornithine deacetylase [Rhodospirillaceae bacterium]|nr:acetylornithine deacetylase [Rhodospirillaceae bacterium]MDD9926009.1 acetylornithine deacetylase [Rhodospirillaceae bacterium]